MNGATVVDILCTGGLFALAAFALFGRGNGLLGRLTSSIGVIAAVVIIVTALLHIVPGDPVDAILGEQAPVTSKLALKQELGLADADGNPLGIVAQVGRMSRGLATNSLKSYLTRQPVWTEILPRMPYTAALAFAAICIALLVGPPFGVIAAWQRRRFWDHALLALALVFVALPRFVLGPILILVLAMYLDVFPVSGADEGLLSLFLPALTLGVALAALQTRLVRASLLDVLQEDFVRTARSKGLSERVVFVKHALRNALLPLITVVGLELGGLLSGAVVTEKIFNWPGIGLQLLESIQRLDMPMVQALVILMTTFVVVINFVVDTAYSLIDPRIRKGAV